MDDANMHVMCDRDIVRLGTQNDAKTRAINEAIDELRRWQNSDDIEDIRHSIDMAVRTLEGAR